MRRRAVFTSCHFRLSTAEEMLSSIVSQQVGKMRRGAGGVVGSYRHTNANLTSLHVPVALRVP